ncbi:hypothetical protein GCM10010965_18980 [Caldalkalibacillus thermarum]|nr:hypothetical protein GCM10010965_18980 [Caldalkalibacillus thermarum]
MEYEWFLGNTLYRTMAVSSPQAQRGHLKPAWIAREQGTRKATDIHFKRSANRDGRYKAKCRNAFTVVRAGVRLKKLL